MPIGKRGPDPSNPSNAVCRKCYEEKPLDSFNRDHSRANGKHPYCRSCVSIYRKSEVAKLRKRVRMPWRSKVARDYHREYNKRPHAAEENRRRANEYRLRYPERIAARQALKKAVKARVVRWPNNCEKCGTYCKTEAHHHKGYAPEFHLDVVWMCRSCHKRSEPRFQRHLVLHDSYRRKD